MTCVRKARRQAKEVVNEGVEPAVPSAGHVTSDTSSGPSEQVSSCLRSKHPFPTYGISEETQGMRLERALEI